MDYLCKYVALGRTYEFAPTSVGTLHNSNRLRHPIKYRYGSERTIHLSMRFMQTVGVDSYVCPTVPSCTTVTATRHQIMVTINEMNEWIICASMSR